MSAQGTEPALIAGIALRVRPGTKDAAIAEEVIARDEYAFAGSRAAEMARPLIVDIGCHIGSFSAFAATVCPQARVVACEANPANYALAKTNLAPWSRVAILPGAVIGSCAREGRELFVSAFLGRDTGGWNRWSQGRTRIPTIDFGALVRRLKTVHFLKMDCEGSEYAIVADSDPAVFRHIERISMELHDGPGVDPEALLGRLAPTYEVLERRRTGRTLTFVRLLRRGVDEGW